MEKFETTNRNIEKREVAFEVMKTPEIVIQGEKGTQLFSLLLKAENSNWGETETSLAKETMDYFKDNPLPTEVINSLRGFHEQGVDEEALYNLALTYQHPERAEKVLEMATKYKPHVKNPKEIHQKVLKILEIFDHIFSNSPLAEKFTTEIEKDRNERLKKLEETKRRIEVLIDFFKPDSKTTDIKKVSLTPTDPLYKRNAGRAFSAFPGEQIIISHIDNIDNQDHEFSHGIINPIVEKLSQQLTDEQKEKIAKLASEKLRQDYGEGYLSLLGEEFIRTYIDVFRKGEKPETYEDFVQKVSEITEDQFQKELSGNLSFQQRCENLGIETTNDLLEKSEEYFKKFEKNPLRDLVFEFYQEYETRPNKENTNFEQFVLSKFSNKLL